MSEYRETGLTREMEAVLAVYDSLTGNQGMRVRDTTIAFSYLMREMVLALRKHNPHRSVGRLAAEAEMDALWEGVPRLF